MAGGAALMEEERASHYWDPERRVGVAYQGLANLSGPAWDVWMLFAPGVVWEAEPPSPDWWEHQLSGLDADYGDRRLDSDRFARKALELSAAE